MLPQNKEAIVASGNADYSARALQGRVSLSLQKPYVLSELTDHVRRFVNSESEKFT